MEENSLLQNTTNTQNLQTFKGLPVAHRFHTPIEELEYTEDEGYLEKMYSKKVKKDGLSYKSKIELPIDTEIIMEALDKIMLDFPFGEDKDTEEIKEMILKDFPTLTEQEIGDNIDLIDEYYAHNLAYSLYTNIAEDNNSQTKITAKSKANKISGIIDDIKEYNDQVNTLIDHDKVTSYHRTLAKIACIKAGYYSIKFSRLDYQDLGSADTKEDALRHALWSALLAKYYYTISSKVTRINFAKAVGDANEDLGTTNTAAAHQMDYQNNKLGRSVFNYQCSYKKIGLGRVMV